MDPTLNLSVELFGIINSPLTEPPASVTKFPPNDPPVGLQWSLTKVSSKYGNTLVAGLNPLAVNSTLFDLM